MANAKIFNPPGSIYYTEADKIEIWGLDHINKAASTVIQYETDWTIDVEKEEEEQSVNVDQDEDDSRGTPMDIDGSILRERSLSVAPSQPQGSTRRGVRGPYRRERNAPSNALSETLELDGGLPGSKDGIGAFPPESDWARTMLALKLKGLLLVYTQYTINFIGHQQGNVTKQKRSECVLNVKDHHFFLTEALTTLKVRRNLQYSKLGD